MFPQRSRMNSQSFQYFQGPHQLKGYPQTPPQGGLFGYSRQEGYPPPYSHGPAQFFQHNQRPVQQQKQSFFRNEQGQIDLQKIGGGVQTVIGFVNQVSPMIKMFGGFLK